MTALTVCKFQDFVKIVSTPVALMVPVLWLKVTKSDVVLISGHSVTTYRGDTSRIKPKITDTREWEKTESANTGTLEIILLSLLQQYKYFEQDLPATYFVFWNYPKKIKL